jgi:hypothetical protein
LSHSQRETIERLRRWLTEGRATSASFDESELALRRSVPLPSGPLVEA